MPDVGDVRDARLVVEGGTAGTIATVVVYPPRGSTLTPAATTVDVGVTWLAEVTYTLPGLWRFLWTVTQDGEPVGTEWFEVAVSPGRVATGRRYADTVDLAEYLHDAPPLDADQLLIRATEVVDALLRTSRYPVDAAGEPTDAAHIAAMKRATCSIVDWWVATGDPLGAAARFTSVSINGVSLSRGGSGGGGDGGTGDLIGPDALRILRLAGLLYHPPGVPW